MTAKLCTPAQIAQAARVTEKHVRRMISRALGAGPYVSSEWYGARMDVVKSKDGPLVAFPSLPDHIRENLLVMEQPELPLPPPEQTKLD